MISAHIVSVLCSCVCADGREVEAKRAVPREESNPAPSHGKIKKVFLGGLHVDTKEEDIRTVLEQFGEVSRGFSAVR